eukprot:Hpha_TRINITY_DN14982_c4_g2::TRINITY_DN14982_c4_g2_i2::g.143419::m.143419
MQRLFFVFLGGEGSATVFCDLDTICMNECVAVGFDEKSRAIRFVGASRFGHAGKEALFDLPAAGVEDALSIMRELVPVQEAKLERRASCHIARASICNTQDEAVTEDDPTIYSAVRICCEMSSQPALQMLLSVMCAAAGEAEPEPEREAWGGALDSLLEMEVSADMKPLCFLKSILGHDSPRGEQGGTDFPKKNAAEVVQRLSLVAGAGEVSENLALLLRAAEGEAKDAEAKS